MSRMRAQKIGADVAGWLVVRSRWCMILQRQKQLLVVVEQVTGLHLGRQETLPSSFSVICLLCDMSWCHLRARRRKQEGPRAKCNSRCRSEWQRFGAG